MEYQARPGAAYIAISGAFWVVAGLALLWIVLTAKPWGRLALAGFAIAYSLYYWIDRLAFQYPHANWPFAVIVNLALGALVAVLLLLPGTRHYFGRSQKDL